MATDLLDPANCACFHIRRMARRITQAYDRALKPAGLTATQFSMLWMVGRLADSDGITLSRLARSLGTDRTTLTRNLSLARRAGWVAHSAGADRRERRIRLTTAGKTKVAEALPLWQSAQENTLSKLSERELTDLLALSAHLAEA